MNAQKQKSNNLKEIKVIKASAEQTIYKEMDIR